MVRYAISLGKRSTAAQKAVFDERDVDLKDSMEQCSEEFLCELNPKGQVPVLTHPSFAKPIADSLKITYHLAELYPSLMPATHREQIVDLLDQLHAINYFSLSFTGRSYVPESWKGQVRRILDGQISNRYRAALEYKLRIVEDEKVAGLKPELVQSNVERTRALMKVFQGHLKSGTDDKSTAQWLFDLPQPSALDAHFVSFVARLTDLGRNELVPHDVAEYLDRAQAKQEWKDVMQGRLTMEGH